MMHSELANNLPKRFRDAIRTNYLELSKSVGDFDAQISTLSASKTLDSVAPLLSSSDYELCEFAKLRARECFEICARWLIPDIALSVMEGVAKRYGIEPPKTKTKEGARARLLCELWWRRQLRRVVARNFEQTAISLGLVSKFKGKYASDETLARRVGQVRRNKRILKSIVATNDDGQSFTLDELAALGVSNPNVRGAELAVRMKGFDEIAKSLNHQQWFFTITAPSRFHAVDSATGKRNKKYTDATPKEAQAHLSEGWAFIRAALLKKNIKLYGFRIVEPHQDGTPHWHMALNFEREEDTNAVLFTIEQYALRSDGEENGAAYKYSKNGREFGARFDAKKLDERGATGYLLKYILKNINPTKMHDTQDFEGGDLLNDLHSEESFSVSRVEAWATCWGIRQFQQIGGAPVGVWRELRRLGEVDASLEKYGVLDGLQHAADTNNWAAYINIMGGVNCKRVDLIVKVSRAWQDLRTRYDGYGAFVVDGVEAINGNFAKTRFREWVLSAAFKPLGFMSITVTDKKEGEKQKDEKTRFRTGNADTTSRIRET